MFYSHRNMPLRLALTIGLLGSTTARGQEHDSRCDALFEEAARQLAAEQYSAMLGTAEDRQRVCPGPQSAFLIGLAQANLVDALAIVDPAEREMTRRSALRNLRVAAAGAELKTVWQFTVHDWIVHLQSMGPEGSAPLAPERDAYEAESADLQDLEPLEVPPAPPPQPQPVFPWGPVLTGIVGLGGLTTGLILGIAASDDREKARSATQQLRLVADDLEPKQLSAAISRTRELNEDADSKADWSAVFLIGGAISLVGSIVWYVAVPPDGKWRWAASPTEVQATVRF